MTDSNTLQVSNLVPLLVVITAAFVCAILIPVPQLVVPSAVFLSGLCAVISCIVLHGKLRSSAGMKLALGGINFVLTTALTFLVLKAVAQAIL
ncbi:hypothetical protein [Corynebacterium nasicanis]|uniref:Uncharacterized protein n=1 Tax=Corynebacterium nasicanis TaxID=1448267 RepID=A0ABW1QFQ9_9CORY